MKYLIPFLSLLMFVVTGCESSTTDVVDEDTIEISADKQTVAIGELVTFRVVSSLSGDVTSQCTFVCGDVEATIPSMSWNEAGTYTVSAWCERNGVRMNTTNSVDITVEPSSWNGLSYTISADITTVYVGEVVTFYVTSSEGEDVTEQSTMCTDINCFAGNTYSWSEAGTYGVFGHYMGEGSQQPGGTQTENTVMITVLDEEQTPYTLEVDKTVFYVGEAATYTVRDEEGNDVTADFTIGEVDGATYLGNVHICTEAGAFRVQAVSNADATVKTKSIKITVKEQSVSTDPSRFYRRTLMAEMSGTWCWSCPFMARAIEYCQSALLYDRMVVIAFHDDLSEQGGLDDRFTDIMTAFRPKLWGNIPSYILNWNADYCSGSTFSNFAEDTPSMAQAALDAQAIDDLAPGIAVTTSLAGSQLSVTVNVTSKESADYLLGAVLTEDNIRGYQNNALNREEWTYHMHVGQAMITSSDVLAESVGSIAEGEERSFQYTVTIPQGCVVENCNVVVYVCKENQNEEALLGYLASNTVSCPVGESIGYQYEVAQE